MAKWVDQRSDRVLGRWKADGKFTVKSIYGVLSDGGTRDAAPQIHDCHGCGRGSGWDLGDDVRYVWDKWMARDSAQSAGNIMTELTASWWVICKVEDRRVFGCRLRVWVEPGHACRGRPIASDYKQSDSVARWVMLTEDISSLPCRSGALFIIDAYNGS
uniref:Uncharacterized protein n=1 Tax=Ananas comosus var. bracteatus TaxID=296719 RepID=A0A6V7NS20_ANACO|nr:unnamed protein product [Ananas comosus var. bracteatus]